MGYRTYFQINADHEEKHEEMWLWAKDNIPELEYSVDNFEGGCSDYNKWYDWHEDMLKLSCYFPEVTFKIHGEGEESLDIWDAVFRGGKCIKQTCIEQQVIDGETSTDLLEEAYNCLKNVVVAEAHNQSAVLSVLVNLAAPTMDKIRSHLDTLKGEK